VGGESPKGRHRPARGGRLEDLVGVCGLPCQKGDETGHGEDEDQDDEEGHDRRGHPVLPPEPEAEPLMKGESGYPDDRRPDQGNAEWGQYPVEKEKEEEGKSVGNQGPEHSPVHGDYFMRGRRGCPIRSAGGPRRVPSPPRFPCPQPGLPIVRVAILPSSRSHSTELATAAQRSQSPAVKLTVENACCRNGI